MNLKKLKLTVFHPECLKGLLPDGKVDAQLMGLDERTLLSRIYVDPNDAVPESLTG